MPQVSVKLYISLVRSQLITAHPMATTPFESGEKRRSGHEAKHLARSYTFTDVAHLVTGSVSMRVKCILIWQFQNYYYGAMFEFRHLWNYMLWTR